MATAVYCGGGSEESAVERRKKYIEEKEKESGQIPQEQEDLVKGPNMPVAELEEGTCAYAAAQFAIGIKDIDTARALKYCNDTMKTVVRALLANPEQVERMQMARDAGFSIKYTRLVENQTEPNTCRACVTASFQENDMEDCSFKLRLENGEWKIYDFGTRADY
jgi:hypothetical protein